MNAQLNIKIPDTLEREMRRHVTLHGYATLSEFLRLAIKNQMKSDKADKGQ